MLGNLLRYGADIRIARSYDQNVALCVSNIESSSVLSVGRKRSFKYRQESVASINDPVDSITCFRESYGESAADTARSDDRNGLHVGKITFGGRVCKSVSS